MPPPKDSEYQAPDFQTREKVNQLFSNFTEWFSRKKHKKGISLYWLGTGTWQTPNEIIPEKNMEGWQLTQENAKKGNLKKLKGAENNEKQAETIRLIRRVPLSSGQIISAPNAYREQVIKEILASYREIIKEAKTLISVYEDEYEDLNQHIFDQASNHINEQIKAHWLGKKQSQTVG